MIKEHKTSVAPTAEPVTLAELKEQLRIEISTTEDDTFLEGLIASSRQAVEALLGKVLIDQTVVAKLNEFPKEEYFELPTPPVSSVTSITYYDDDNAIQTLASADYSLNDYCDPQRIVRNTDVDWPTTYDRWDAITVTYQAGYATASAVPASIKTVIKMLAAETYENRGFSDSDATKNKMLKAASVLLEINKTAHL
jgi:uncharacterized phiE125 gp8 family phage protein